MFITNLTLLFETPSVRFIIGHVLINLAFALAAAIRENDFDTRRVVDFLWHKLIPLVIGYATVSFFGDWSGLGFLAPIALVAIETTLLGDLLDNLMRLGLKMPMWVSKAVSMDTEE